MSKKIKPCIPNEDQNIFSEGIDYSKTGKTSIWGHGDKDTLKLLKKIEIHGKWLNLEAGDWGYTPKLLKKVDFVVAADIDGSALSKLKRNTFKKYAKKFETQVFDITKKFPLRSHEFDGVFCTGTLHLFTKGVLKKIFLEIDRVLKPKGRVVIDYATDIKRVTTEGKSLTFGREPLYTTRKAIVMLRKLFKDYKITLSVSECPKYLIKTKPHYYFSSKFILFVADKK
jgi:SAM-dependent methyltransferase